MACDIHFHSEIKVDGQWRHYSAQKVERWYTLFAIMANVRNEDQTYTPISMPKGLPNDLSFETAFCYEWEKGDAHSESWFGSKEIETLYSWIKDWPCKYEGSDLFGYCLGQAWNHFEVYKEGLYHNIEDIRFVFWFDN